jgi:hypothetical protein
VLSKAGGIADDEMQHIANHYSNVTIDRFVIVPNPVHAIIAIEGNQVYSPHARDGASPVSTAECLRATMGKKRKLSGRAIEMTGMICCARDAKASSGHRWRGEPGDLSGRGAA